MKLLHYLYRSSIPSKRSKRHASASSSVSNFSWSPSKSPSESHSSYSTSRSSSHSFTRSSSSSFHSSYSHSGSSHSRSVSRSFSSSSRSRSASPKPTTSKLKQEHAHGGRLKKQIQNKRMHSNHSSSEYSSNTLSQHPTRDWYFDRRSNLKKNRSEHHRQVPSQQSGYRGAASRKLYQHRKPFPHSVGYLEAEVYSSQRERRRHNFSQGSSHFPPSQKKRVISHTVHQNRYQPKHRYPVSVTTQFSARPRRRSVRRSVSPVRRYHQPLYQESNRAQRKEIKPKLSWDQSKSEFGELTRARREESITSDKKLKYQCYSLFGFREV